MSSDTGKHVISTCGPSPSEQLHNAQLEAWCQSLTEPASQSNLRMNVLKKLSVLCKQWIKSVMITEFRMSAENAEEVGGRIFTTGSYRYNVHSVNSDIDVVLVAPEKITRKHFFTTFVERLRNEPWITDLSPTEETRVPIIAMRCDGIDIDLSFGTVQRPTVPDNIDVLDDNILRNLDDASVRAVGAVRVAQVLIDSVPNKSTFRQALRFVKAWGKARGLYASQYGYPTGIGWAILVAKVCQCYPNLNAAGLACRFFKFYVNWFHPDPTSTNPNRAIFLSDSLTPPRVIPGMQPSWDPKTSFGDAQALFPILTPAVPYANACVNVTRTTLRIMCSEFRRAHEYLSSVIDKPVNPALENGIWGFVLESIPFFTMFKHYLHVTVGCSAPELAERWFGAVEAKARFLWSEGPYSRHGDPSTKGIALETYPQLRVHVFSKLGGFIDPEQAKLADLLKKHGGSTPRSSIAPIGNSPLTPHDVASRGSRSLEQSQTVLTTNFYFGLETVETATPVQRKLDI